MRYDSSLDDRIFFKSWESEIERLTVSVYSYNKGPRKLQITREVKDGDGNYRFAKLGRLNKQEIEAILPLIQESVQYLD